MISLCKIISFILLVSPLNHVGYKQGWVQVERPKKDYAEQNKEEDSSIWPVFAKQLGSERILLRFPEDPAYHYPGAGVEDFDSIVVGASRDDWTFQMSAAPRIPEDLSELIQRKIAILDSDEEVLFIHSHQVESRVVDLLYRSKDQWVRERVLSAPEHLYVLRTSGPTLSDAKHHLFISSFDLEIRGSDQVFHREFST